MAEKVRDYPKLAQSILDAVGGKSNVIGATRCATRLRLVLKKSSPEAKAIVGSLPGVITVVESGGQFQVVIGQHVGEVFESFAGLVNLDDTEVEQGDKRTVLNRIIATMSAVFAPFIYILAAAGILQGILILINLVSDSFASTGTYQVLSFMSWAPFTFLPIFIAITASKYFKVNTFIAVACSVALVSPDWATIAASITDGASINFLGIPLTGTTYTSSVLPPLLLVWFLSYVERFLNKRIHEIVRPLLVPLLSMVIMVPLTILLLGPLSTWGANGIAAGYNFLAENLPWLAGAIIGSLWQIIVIFGVHWGVLPMVLANFDLYGQDSFQAYQTIAIIAQIGAVLGVILKTKNQETRKVGVSAGITGMFGITEPAIYGVTLKFKKPMIYGCISGGIGAIAASFFNPFYFAYAGLPGPLTLVNGISDESPMSIWGILIGAAIAFILPVILIQIFGYGEDKVKVTAAVAPTPASGTPAATAVPSENGEEAIFAPLVGRVVALSEVPDEAFSSGAMGQGVAIEPLEGKLYAPFAGTVATTTPSKHAIGLRSTSGVELFVHIGIDTVKLKGAPFTLHVKEGDSINKGDLLIEFDIAMIKNAGMPIITPVLITNAYEYQNVIQEDADQSALTHKLLTVIK
ncbi:PTS system beta-glucoside-specific EIIBCA component [compost metagenome]